jgi:NADP-dependent 3-hydroxy acid dehydrogenase YdfG
VGGHAARGEVGGRPDDGQPQFAGDRDRDHVLVDHLDGEFYERYAVPADSFARAVAFAMSQPEDVDIDEILFRPTRQEL